MASGGIRDPFLATSYEEEVEGCPGCKTAHLNRKGARPPYKILFYLAVLVLSNSLPISSVFPFLYFMVRDFGIAKTDADIGYYVGFIGSSFMLGRFFTSMAWGTAADRYGRRIVMFAGVISVIVFNTLFGFSTSFWMAVSVRFLLGSFNGMLGPVKAYASEICSEEHQAVGVAVVGTTWGVGLVLGPALGGYLAQPALKYPAIFAKTIFDKFPYLLPSLCTSGFAIVSLATTFGLPETLHKHNKRKSSDALSSKIIVDVADENGEIKKNSAIKEDPEAKISTRTTASTSIWRNWGLMASIILYCLWSLHDIAYTEIFSLWAVSPRETGGLGFTSSGVGNVLSISGFAMLLFQLLFFPSLARYLGPVLLTRLGALFSIPVLAAYSFIATLQNTALLWAAVISASIAKNVLSVTIFTASFLLINNSVTQDQRGTANGLSMSLVSLFKAIGPAGGGSIFAWAQTRLDASFLPGDSLVFFTLNFISLLTALATFEPFLPRSIDKPIAHLPPLVQRSISLDRHH